MCKIGTYNLQPPHFDTSDLRGTCRGGFRDPLWILPTLLGAEGGIQFCQQFQRLYIIAKNSGRWLGSANDLLTNVQFTFGEFVNAIFCPSCNLFVRLKKKWDVCQTWI